MRGKIDLSQLRKTMWSLNRKRGLLQRNLHRPSRMIIGSILEVISGMRDTALIYI